MSSENESVSPPLNIEKCSLVLVDVAGTTTSIDFVKDTLFPYVTQQVETFLKGKWNDEPVKECVQLIKEEESDLDIPSAVEKIKTLTAEQSSNKGLKTLQGLIYKEGYEKGDLKAHVFDDIPECFESWAKNRRVAIYSTGSVDSQKLLFKHTIHGDVSTHIHKYFDQTVGSKTESDSYKAIAKDVEVSPEQIIFITDDVKEATAAKTGGVTAVLIKREGNAALPDDVEKEFMVISSFKDLGLDKTAKRKIEEEVAEEAPPSKISKTDATEVAEPKSSTTEEKGESMEVDPPTVEEKKSEETEKSSEIKSTPEETEKTSVKEPEKTETEIKEDNTKTKEENTAAEKMETIVEENVQKEATQNAARENEESKMDVAEEKKETQEVGEARATKEEKPKEVAAEKVATTEEAKEEMQTEETKTEEIQTEETKADQVKSETTEKVEETKVTEGTTKEETKTTDGVSKEETKVPEEAAKQKTDGVEEAKETTVKETTVDEPHTSQDKPEEKEETKVELAKTEELNPAEAGKDEPKPAENGEEKPESEEAETSNKVEEKENKSVLANGVENGKDESEVDNTPGESAEVKIDDDKNDETDVRVKKLEESAESKTVSVEV